MVPTEKFQAPKGTYDVLPQDAPSRWRVQLVARELLEVAGYGELITPTLEETELFSRSVGEATDIVQKEMYTFEDRGGRSLTLRPEGTAPVCRAYIQHGMKKLPQPVKIWYSGPMYRYEAPQSGRYRQHYQIGAEAIGSADPALDAELIAMLGNLYRRLGISEIRLRLSSIGDSVCRPEYVRELRTFLLATDSFTAEQRKRIELNPLRVFDWQEGEAAQVTQPAPKMIDRLCEPCRRHLEDVQAALDELGIGYDVDPALVRGLDYYTRTVFEFTCDLLGAQNGVGGGGRYDRLIEELGGEPTPAAGWATGVERILLAMERSNVGDEEFTKLHAPHIEIFVAVTEPEARARALRLVTELRDRGVSADMEYAGRSLKGQMKHAGRAGVDYVVILDPEELERGVVTLRDMAAGEQQEAAIDGLVNDLRNRV